MPRTVDMDTRRRDIADALLGLVEQRGLAAATVREVAAAAGVSLGAVQRCFATRAEMVLFALDRINERFKARVTARLDGATPGPREGTRLLIIEMLPFSEAGRSDARLALAFLGVAAADPQIAAALSVAYRGALDFFQRTLSPADAVRLLALIDGLRAPLLLGHLETGEALAAIDAHLDALY